jgi:hypothetical protein
MSGLLKDVNGNVSSKRVAGYVLMGISVIGGAVGSIVGNHMLVDFSKWLIVSGVGALVAGVAERKT